ncbi:MAG: beta-lactamase family protein [Clostridiales bacterium]|nr:beta-lactamase family protein [Clostridiales bacterium]
MTTLIKELDELINEKYANHLGVKIGVGDKVLFEKYASPNNKFDENSMIEVASVTKMVVTTSLALVAMTKGLLSKDDLVSKFFEVPDDRKNLTIENVMTHSIGYGGGNLCLNSVTRETVQKTILSKPMTFTPGERTEYSCLAFILLGKILEQIFNEDLDTAFKNYVAKPLGMLNSTFNYKDDGNYLINVQQSYEARTLVNDFNARYLGGMVGNAGLFTCMKDCSLFVKMLLNDGQPIISKEVFDLAIKNYTKNPKDQSRGLGFLYVDEKYTQTANLFPVGSIGHCGHTGQSIFIDPISKLYVIILSDATKTTYEKLGYGDYNKAIELRTRIHKAIKQDLEKSKHFL